MKIAVVVGARPQFIKHAPFELACKGNIDLITIHTGQHYDDNMNKVFFDQFNLKKPDYMLETGGGNHGEQTGKMLTEIEPILVEEKPSYVLVYGDTNSTLAGALAAAKLNIPVIHIEAGLRSFNREMPEEINRVVTDHISYILFTSTEQALANLNKEGLNKRVHLIGDIMADSIELANQVDGNFDILDEPYCYATIHRPYNTDNPDRLRHIMDILNQLDLPVIFSIHPRTRKVCKTYGVDLERYFNIRFTDPLSYFDNIHYLKNAAHAITDSGGVQKEAYILKTPCITIRSETEWVETLRGNWNVLCFDNLNELPRLISRELGVYYDAVYGDGKSAQHIVSLLKGEYAVS